MGLLIPIVDHLAVEVEVCRHHRLGRAAGDGVPVNIDSGERQGCRYFVSHSFDVVWRDESAALR
jgi:hypothetical protein